METARQVHMQGVTVASCLATLGSTGMGGGVYIEGNSEVTMSDTTISDCASAFVGGGICVQAGAATVSLSGCSILRCIALNIIDTIANSGGGGIALFSSDASMSVVRTTIAECEAVRAGGGIIVAQASPRLSLIEINVTNCTSPLGAALYFDILSTYSGIRAALLTISPRCEQANYPELAISSAESAIFEVSAPRILTTEGCPLPRVDQLLGPLVTLASCENARDLPVCGPAATCGSSLITLGDSTQLPTTSCHCDGNTYPFLAAPSAASSPYLHNYGKLATDSA